MAKIELKFFGRLGDLARAAGSADHNVAANIAELIDSLSKQDEHLGEALNAPSTKVMVNQVIVHKDTALSDGDEVAFLPPVSGG